MLKRKNIIMERCDILKEKAVAPVGIGIHLGSSKVLSSWLMPAWPVKCLTEAQAHLGW